MFIFSLKSAKGKLLLLTAVVLTAAVICGVCFGVRAIQSDAPADGAVDYSAGSEEELKAFIAGFGWTVESEPLSAVQVVIPEEFDKVYSAYNDIQLAQGLDLAPYKGCTVKKWTFAVTNFPEYEGAECIRINLLVYKGRVIGGDLCSVELDGFMTGFNGK